LLWVSHAHFQLEDQGMQNAIPSHLCSMLAELEKSQNVGHFPSLEADE